MGSIWTLDILGGGKLAVTQVGGKSRETGSHPRGASAVTFQGEAAEVTGCRLTLFALSLGAFYNELPKLGFSFPSYKMGCGEDKVESLSWCVPYCIWLCIDIQ